MATDEASQAQLPDAITAAPGTSGTINGSVTPGEPSESLQIEGDTHDSSEDAIEYPTGSKLWLAMISLSITQFIRSADVTIIAVAVPSLTNEFRTVNDIGWYNSAYMMVIGATGFFFGKWYTLFDTKRTYLASLVIFWIGSVICTFAGTSSTFIAGRAISGLASCCEASGFVTLINNMLPKDKRPRGIGNVYFVGSAGLVFGPLFGGLLIQRFGWRACFGINIPLYAVCTIIAWYCIPIGSRKPKQDLPLKEKLNQLDVAGSLIFAPALTCMLMALAWGGTTYGWGNGRIIGLFVASTILLVGFAGLQYHAGDKASIPPRMLKQRSILAASLFSCCCNGALVVTENYISIYFQGVQGLSPAQSALLGIPMIVGLMAASLIAGYGTTWIGYYVPFMLVTSIIAPVASGVLTTISLESQVAFAAGILGLLGFAIGTGLNTPMIAVSSVLDPAEVSIGAAIVFFGSSMGSAIFSAVAGALFQNRLEVEVSNYAKGINVTALEHAGLGRIRSLIGPDNLKNVLLGYDKAFVQTLYIPVALTALTVVASLMTEWKSIKSKKE